VVSDVSDALHDMPPGPLSDLYEPEAPPPAALNGHAPEHAPLQPVDLGSVMRKKLPPPKVVANLLYGRTVHLLSGPPESAKTVLALWLALRAMRGGSCVLMIDEETGRRQVADLFNSMGAEPELIDERFVYFEDAELRWTPGDRSRLADVLTQRQPKLTIVDSFAEILSAANVDENDPGAVTRFVKSNVRPIARQFGSAALVIDHDTKSEKQSRYSRGTGAKLSAGEVGIKAWPVRPFSRTQEGMVNLTVAKDRFGCLHRYWSVRVVPQPLLDLKFTKSTAAEESGSGSGLSPAAEKLLSVLTEQPSTGTQLVDRVVSRYGPPGYKRETVSRIMGALAERGVADRVQHGRDVLWFKPGATILDEVPPPDDPSRGSGWPEGTIGDEVNA
jgi:hypothetical protein